MVRLWEGNGEDRSLDKEKTTSRVQFCEEPLRVMFYLEGSTDTENS